ncbi:MAG: YceI family protein [Dokdonella sp.]
MTVLHCTRVCLLGLATGFVWWSLAATAAASIVYLDSDRSSAEFGVRVMWMFEVEGRFDKVEGLVNVDRFHNRAAVDVRVDAATVQMDDPKREDWVRSAEFFDVDRYPQIRFVSDPFPLQRLERGGDLAGTLTVRGIAKPIRFTLLPALCDTPAYGCAVEAEGFIHRSAFGMRSKRALLSDKVRLRFSMYAVAAATRLDR